MTVIIVQPVRHVDPRGWFCETWNARRFAAQGISNPFCQDNRSFSCAAFTLRGLHYQRPPHAQAKLVECLRGRIFDVAVDIRKDSPSFGQWAGVELSAATGKQLFIPAGYAHGFLTLEPDCEVAYKVDAHYNRDAEGGIAWNDPAIGIDWPLGAVTPLLSAKDEVLGSLSDFADVFPYDGRPLCVVEASDQ